MKDADVAARPPAGQLDVGQVVYPVLGTLPGRRLAGGVKYYEVALQAQAIIPVVLLAPADQVGSAVKPVAQQPHPGQFGQPGGNRLKQRPLSREPDGACWTRQASGRARSPQRSASI